MKVFASFQAFALTGAVLLGGCRFDPGGLESVEGGTADAKIDADGGMPPDPSWSPALVRPAMGAVLPNRRGYLLWSDGVIPPGRTVTGYELCRTTGGIGTIDEESECPGPAPTPRGRRVLDPLLANPHAVKVRTILDGPQPTLYSGVLQFTADGSTAGWWRFDEGAGTNAGDSSAAGLNGTLVNFTPAIAWTTGLVNGALALDGVDDYVDFGNNFNFERTNPFSLEIWANRTTAGTSQALFSKIDYSSPAFRGYWLGYGTGDNLIFILRNDQVTGNRLYVQTTATFPAGARHVAVTYDGSSLAAGVRIYVNGVNQPLTVVTDALTGTILTSASLRIGGSAGMGGAVLYPFPGILDDASIDSRVLAPSEVVNSMCAREDLAGTDPLPASCN